MTDQVNLKTYKEVLKEVKDFSGEKNLLLGNGFNVSLKVYTGYKSIFERMQEENLEYKNKEIEEFMDEKSYDIEELLIELRNRTSGDNFLPNFVENQVKFDFMKSAYGIVKHDIGKIYQNINQGVYDLLQNFNNYFTLNYDPLLYLLLMRFKQDSQEMRNHDSQNNNLPSLEDLNPLEETIREKIKYARANGLSTILVHEERTLKLKECTKAEFQQLMKIYFKKEVKEEGWKNKYIENACAHILKKENMPPELQVNDGFFLQGKELAYKPTKDQNLFFLHGAFHLYKDRNAIIRKITQTQDKALYERLEKIIHGNETDIVWVFRGKQEDKEDEIDGNPYLQNCHTKLTKLKGCLVILGSSLGDNDGHIFKPINDSEISDIYISTKKEDETAFRNKAKELFPHKNRFFFDCDDISYKSPTD